MAELALAAVDSGVEGDAVAGGEGGHGGADGFDRAGGLVAHDDGRQAAAGGTVKAVDVAAADAAGGDAHQEVVGREGGHRERLELELAIGGEFEGLHGRHGEGLSRRGCDRD